MRVILIGVIYISKRIFKSIILFILLIVLSACNIDNLGNITVRFYVDGSLHHETEVNEEGFVLADEPIKEGYVFDWWYLDEDFNEELSLDRLVISGDINLYAKFVPSDNTEYKVLHYLENLDDDNFSLEETDVLVGTTNELVEASNKNFEGFLFDENNENNLLSSNLNADGSLELKLYYVRERFNVEFDSNGGSEVATILNIKYGSKLESPSTNYKDYIFLGWFIDDDLYDFDLEIEEDLTLKAKWEKEETYFTVKFDTDGGSVINDSLVKENERVEKPEDPTKDGYKFIGWFKDDDLYDFDLEIEEDLTLKVKWEKDATYFIVKFDTDGGYDIIDDVKVLENNNVWSPITPTKDGYLFQYWTLNGQVYNFSRIVEEDITLKAKWKKAIYHTITFDTNGGTVIEDVLVLDGERLRKPSDPVKEGYDFGFWLSNGAIYDFLTPVRKDLVLEAHFISQIREYTISYYPEGGTVIDNVTVIEGSLIPKPDDPVKEGYIFSGWLHTSPIEMAGKEVDFENYEVYSNIGIRPVWEKKVMNMLSFGLDGGRWADGDVGAKISYHYAGDEFEI